MNRRTAWTLHDLHQTTDLPKTTVFRLLKALQQEGYVQADSRHGTYRLTALVQELAAGYSEFSRLVDVAAPIALALTRKIKWPLAIGTLDRDAMVVRYSTMPNSPLAVQATTVGQRLGLLETAMGRVYLAFCDDTQRAVLMQCLADAARTGGVEIPVGPLSEITTARRHGYAVRLPDSHRSSATLAVPVMVNDEAIAAIGMTTFGGLMTAETIAIHLPHLTEAARAVSAAYLASAG